MTSILTVSEIFWPEGGGAERATYLILKLLAQQGFKITVVTGTDSPAIIPGVKYYVSRYLKSSNRLTRWTLARLLATSHAFIKLLKEHDVLYIPLAEYPLIPIAKKAGLRVVVHLHNYMPIRYSGVKYFFEPDVVSLSKELRLAVFHEFHVQKSLLRTLLSPLSLIGYTLSKGWLTNADKIICVSKRQAELVSKNHPQLADKIEVIYNPLPAVLINTEPRKNLSNIPTFLYVGGDSILKGFHILLQALKELDRLGVKTKFILINSYSYDSLKILKMLSEKCKNLKINVVGKVKYEEVINLHKQAWALVFPSICEEPLPYAIVEASLLGTLPIASKIGGVQEILQDTSAEKYIFNPENMKELVEKIKAIVTDEANNFMKDSMALRATMLKFFRESNDRSLRKLIDIFS
jgi:glycosyltransferase involved in cell wall biosynthesis